MVKAASEELVRRLPTLTDKNASLLPPISQTRELAREIGEAVGRQAIEEGQAQIAEADLIRELEANIWNPVYVPYVRKTRSISEAGPAVR
jgi:malate dehydrogenase (oxaloacetate-decarboxylating)